MLKRFHLKGHTIGFRTQTQKLELYKLHRQHHVKVLLRRFHLNGASRSFVQSQNLSIRTPCDIETHIQYLHEFPFNFRELHYALSISGHLLRKQE